MLHYKITSRKNKVIYFYYKSLLYSPISFTLIGTFFRYVIRLFLHLINIRATHFFPLSLGILLFSDSRLTFSCSELGNQTSIYFHLGFNLMKICIVISAFATFIKPYFIFYCSDTALGITGFKVVSYADYSTYGASITLSTSRFLAIDSHI